jgi:cellobiose phosphorylase
MKKTQTIQLNHGQYMPLLNQKGLKGFLTPFFAGHLAIDHDHYLLEPASEHSMYASTTPRNIHIFVDGKRYDVNGLLEHQMGQKFTYETDHTYQKVTRDMGGIQCEVLSFLVLNEDVEIHHITLKNTTDQDKTIQCISAVNVYGRSAENQRDHRHVTGLLNEIHVLDHSIVNVPRLHFDESGHHKNERNYFVSFYGQEIEIEGIIPTVDDYIASGSYQFPNGLTYKETKSKVTGYEAFGGIRTTKKTLKPNASIVVSLLIGSTTSMHESKRIIDTFHDENQISKAFEETKNYYDYFHKHLSFTIQNEDITQRLQDVVLQPVYRRYMGNSYLPHHDYGKGGRGWRDLWQDMIALNMYADPSIVSNMYQYFKGVRLDGTNATIIGEKPGQFIADRNRISRVWSDHGAWPLITLKMYMDETGDLSMLLKKQPYFNDHMTHYGQQSKAKKDDDIFTKYEGTILEHLLIQHMTAIHHLGSHGFIKLLDADWNDGLDMGKKHGETIAFTMMYVKHLDVLSDMIIRLNQIHLTLLKPLVSLIFGQTNLQTYFHEVEQAQEHIEVLSTEIVEALKRKHQAMLEHLRDIAFQHEIFQSYIGHDGKYLDTQDTVMLTGQAMALLNGIATPKQAALLSNKTKHALFKKDLGGYQLNSLYEETSHPLGRAFYFAYGHKENGAVFSHMAMMYIYGLYDYGLHQLGQEGLAAILNQSLVPSNQVYRGIPEYFNDKGHGKYLYLTGSASWLLYVLRRQVFGLRFDYGKLYLEPKLLDADFMLGKATINTIIFGQLTEITYYQTKTGQKQNVLSSIEADGDMITLPITKHYHKINITLE